MGFFLLRMASFFSFVTAYLPPAHLRTAAMPPGDVSIFFLFSLALEYTFHGQSIQVFGVQRQIRWPFRSVNASNLRDLYTVLKFGALFGTLLAYKTLFCGSGDILHQNIMCTFIERYDIILIRIIMGKNRRGQV